MKKTKNKQIPIVFITDDNYVIPTAVAIQSLIDNKHKETKYAIYIISTSLSDDNIRHFHEFESETIQISIIKEDVTNLLNLHKYDITGKCQATPSALLKFKLPLLLSQYDKVIYLDGDILVKKDLSDLYNIDIENNFVGAVHDTGKIYNPQKITKKIPNYFNSGVMLLNLEKCLLKNMPKKLIKLKKKSKDMSLMDQNILNIGFKRHVKMLDIKFNFLALNLSRAIDKFQISDLNKLFHSNYESLQDINNQAYIIHFSSKDKPWKYLDGPYSKEWFRFFRKSPYKNYPLHRIKFDSLHNQTIKQDIIISLTSYPARIGTVNQTIETLLNQTTKADKIVLYLGKDKFPHQEHDLPQELRKLCGDKFEIHWIEKDLKSFTKLIPAIKEYPDSILVTVDDDILYPPEMLEMLLVSYNKNHWGIHCHRAHRVSFKRNRIKPYNQWQLRYTEASVSYNNFLTGVGGVLYAPHCLHNDVFNEEKFMQLCPNADDVWFWAMAIKNGTKIRIIENNITQLNYVDGTQKQALWRSNVTQCKNDEQIRNVLTQYPDVLKTIIKENKRLRQNFIIKFIKHIGHIVYTRSYRGKTDMLNMNFRKIMQQIENLQKNINMQNEKNEDKLTELTSLIKKRT